MDTKDITDKFENEALLALSPCKEDTLCIARILRKYDVQEEDYSIHKSLPELTKPAVPSEIEIIKFSKATEKIKNKFYKKDSSFGSMKIIVDVIQDLYFNPDYNLL